MPFRDGLKPRPLTKKHMEIIRLVGEGMTYREIGSRPETKMSPAAITQLMKREDVKAMQREMMYEALRGSSIKAAKILVKQLDDPNPWVAQQAARTVLQFNADMDKQQESKLVVNFVSMPTPAMPEPEPIPSEAEVH